MATSVLLLLVTSAGTAAVALLALHRRRANPAAGPMAALLASVTLWTASVGALCAGSPPRLLAALAVAQWAGTALTICWLRLFADALVGRAPSRRRGALLAVQPLVVTALLVADPWVHLVYGSVVLGGDPVVRHTTNGPLFWYVLAYHYAVVATVFVDLGRSWRRGHGQQRRTAGTVLVAMLAPLLLNLYYQFVPGGPYRLDLTPVAFAVTAAVCSAAVLRRRLLHLVPVARAVVMDAVSDAVLVLSPDGAVLDANRAAARLLGLDAPLARGVGAVGTPLAGVAPELVALVRTGGAARLRDRVDVDVRSQPITAPDGRALGAVLVVRDVTRAREQERALERALAELREQVATNEALRAELAEEARRDPLTGLHNRRHLAEVGGPRLRAARADGQDVSVVLVDVDHFKAVNDTHGHAVGDDVLVALADLLRAEFRAEDLVRHGGEEFLVLLPGLHAPAARERAERLRARVAAEPLAGLPLTVSAGLASAPGHGEDLEELLRAADAALYAAKGAGRDRVEVAVDREEGLAPAGARRPVSGGGLEPVSRVSDDQR